MLPPVERTESGVSRVARRAPLQVSETGSKERSGNPQEVGKWNQEKKTEQTTKRQIRGLTYW